MDVAILADDLTGACDTGIQFVEDGFRVCVTWPDNQIFARGSDIGMPENDLLVWTTTSRSCSAESAELKVGRANLALLQSGRRLIYKKMDSTLRGNVGAEVDVILATGPHQLALVCPAFPRLGRRLVVGELLLGEADQGTGTCLPTLLREQSSHAVDRVDVAQVRRGKKSLSRRLHQLIAQGTRVCCVDAETDADLAILGETVSALSPDVLPVGSAGLAREMSRQLAKSVVQAADPTLPWFNDSATKDKLKDSAAAPIVCFAGSQNPVTVAQLSQFTEELDVKSIQLDRQTPGELMMALDRGQHVVIRILSEASVQLFLENTLVALAQKMIAGLVLTGGHTAQLVCGAAGARGIELRSQVLPGLAEGRLVGGQLNGRPVVTKAGGFGDADALLKVCSHLVQQHQLQTIASAGS